MWHDIRPIQRQAVFGNLCETCYAVGWDQTRDWRDEVRNYRGKPIRMELRYTIPGDIELTAEDAKLHDFQTVEFLVKAKARQKFAWDYSYTQHFGKNARQNRIALR